MFTTQLYVIFFCASLGLCVCVSLFVYQILLHKIEKRIDDIEGKMRSSLEDETDMEDRSIHYSLSNHATHIDTLIDYMNITHHDLEVILSNLCEENDKELNNFRVHNPLFFSMRNRRK